MSGREGGPSRVRRPRAYGRGPARAGVSVRGWTSWGRGWGGVVAMAFACAVALTLILAPLSDCALASSATGPHAGRGPRAAHGTPHGGAADGCGSGPAPAGTFAGRPVTREPYGVAMNIGDDLVRRLGAVLAAYRSGGREGARAASCRPWPAAGLPGATGQPVHR